MAGVDAGLGLGRGLLDRELGMPASMAFAMPPSSSTSWMWPQAFCASSWSAARHRTSRPTDRRCGWCRFLLQHDLGVAGDAGGEGRSASASASSSALVCSDWCGPGVAAIASMQVRATLLNTSCAASDQPEVCEWARSDSERGSFG
jgi:hypothetical protein